MRMHCSQVPTAIPGSGSPSNDSLAGLFFRLAQQAVDPPPARAVHAMPVRWIPVSSPRVPRLRTQNSRAARSGRHGRFALRRPTSRFPRRRAHAPHPERGRPNVVTSACPLEPHESRGHERLRGIPRAGQRWGDRLNSRPPMAGSRSAALKEFSVVIDDTEEQLPRA